MAEIGALERRKLEKLLGMGSGYVLDFSDRTYAEFFIDFRVDIDAPQFRTGGDSKAKRMRTFWDIAPSHTVGKVLDGLIAYGVENGHLGGSNPMLIDDCRKIAQRLLSDQPVIDLDALTAIADERDFEVVAEHVREAIEKNQPEGALDRLHTFVNKFIRITCEPHGITISRDKPLHSVFGEYVKALRESGHLESVMTDRILRSSISVLEAFNDVRNNKSLAHDNPILNYDESLLVFNHVASSIRFIKSLEARIKAKSLQQTAEPAWDDSIPF
ncbi:MAG: abortive infection family protein [Pseudomonas sp.]|nr:abortive infection family protein [Pseudomonas sp.]